MISYYSQIVILSIVQGISEFIPVSSSAHLLVMSNLSNYKFIYRELDQFSWQFCNKGFFNFKGYIPKIIAKFT